MYIIDDIVYAGNTTPPIRVKSVRPLDDYKLWIRFTTNEEKIFDVAPLLSYACYKPLRDVAIFNSVYVDYGNPVWNDGDIDIAPERLYQDSVSVGKTDI